MIETDSHLKLLLASILDIYKVRSTLICRPLLSIASHIDNNVKIVSNLLAIVSSNPVLGVAFLLEKGKCGGSVNPCLS
jgi:hypothetical protein